MTSLSQSLVILSPDEVEERLGRHFGATVAELRKVALMAAGARRDSTMDDPISAPGSLSYIHGTRGLRQSFRNKKWTIGRNKNIESVISPDRKIEIVFQNVDLAAEKNHSPKAISGKKAASRELINKAQSDLFFEAKVAVEEAERFREVWYFCVSCDEVSGLRAELSRPFPIVGEQFSGFHERLFVAQKGDLEDVRFDGTDELPEQDYGIVISRK